jgi:S-disulfanyl-L-cysteine oxidoreductase SoxD
MRSSKLKVALAAIAFLGMGSISYAQTHYGIGREATPAEIAGWNIDVNREGDNLPAGSGTVAHGREVFETQCAACHGEKGEATVLSVKHRFAFL